MEETKMGAMGGVVDVSIEHEGLSSLSWFWYCSCVRSKQAAN